ncbi:hypothetical protein Ancab_040648 [Ancistrocladus abbreviatus]
MFLHSAVALNSSAASMCNQASGDRPQNPGDARVEAVDKALTDKEALLQELKWQLQSAQHRMKQVADKHQSKRSFKVGDWVYLKFQPYRQHAASQRAVQKLAAKYFGPFKILARVGQVAYKLELLAEVKIHDVFYVSRLKRKIGNASVNFHPPVFTTTSVQKLNPIAILERKMKKKGNQ